MLVPRVPSATNAATDTRTRIRAYSASPCPLRSSSQLVNRAYLSVTLDAPTNFELTRVTVGLPGKSRDQPSWPQLPSGELRGDRAQDVADVGSEGAQRDERGDGDQDQDQGVLGQPLPLSLALLQPAGKSNVHLSHLSHSYAGAAGS